MSRTSARCANVTLPRLGLRNQKPVRRVHGRDGRRYIDKLRDFVEWWLCLAIQGASDPVQSYREVGKVDYVADWSSRTKSQSPCPAVRIAADVALVEMRG